MPIPKHHVIFTCTECGWAYNPGDYANADLTPLAGHLTVQCFKALIKVDVALMPLAKVIAGDDDASA